MSKHTYDPEGFKFCGKVHRTKTKIPGETRTCAAPGCEITFECKENSIKKYCCGGYGGRGKEGYSKGMSWEEKYGVEKAAWMRE